MEALMKSQTTMFRSCFLVFALLAIDTWTYGQCDCSLTEMQLLSAASPVQGDTLGSSIAIDGQVVVAGVPTRENQANPGVLSVGSVVIFRLEAQGDWSQEQELFADDAAAGDNLGSSVAIDGDVAIAGAPMDDDGPTVEVGSAYVFRYNATTGSWSQEAKLEASDAASGDQFGTSVAIQGDTAVIGAPFKDTFTVDAAGAVYVFKKVGSTWNQVQTFSASMPEDEDYFGRSVAIDGSRIVIGGTRSGTSSPGKVWVFKLNGTTWEQEAEIEPDTPPASGDNFGLSVDIEGEIIIAGAHENDDAASNSGAAFVFSYSGGSWIQQQQLTACDASGGESFGFSVSLSAGNLVVGARNASVSSHSAAGAAYVFEHVGGTWSALARLEQSDPATADRFGHAVSISRKGVAVGAPFDGVAPGIDDAGTWAAFNGFAPCECLGDLTDDGNVNAADLAELLASWGPCSSCDADLNVDGDVGPMDLAILLASWGRCGGESAGAFSGGGLDDLSFEAIVVLLGWSDVDAFADWLGEADEEEIHELAEQLSQLLGI
jgi:hypothetical protein